MSTVEYNGPCAGGPGWRKYWERKTKHDIISSLTVYAKQAGTHADEIDALRNKVKAMRRGCNALRENLRDRLHVAEKNERKAWSALDQITWHISGGESGCSGDMGHADVPVKVLALVQDRDVLREERNQLAHAFAAARMGLRAKHPGDPCDNTMERFCMECRRPSGCHIAGCPVGLAERILKES